MDYICEYCNRVFNKKQSLFAHKSHCNENPNKKRSNDSYIEVSRKGSDTYRKLHPEKFIINDYQCTCKRCGKEYVVNVSEARFNRGDYTKYCSLSCRNTHPMPIKAKDKIRKSLKKYFKNTPISDRKSAQYKVYLCKVCGKEFNMLTTRNVSGRQYCSKECKHKFLSERTGGYRKGSGRGKSGWYKGIYCDSTWELAFVIYHIDNNLLIKRCKEYREYTYKNEVHRYLPDFVTDEGIIEIKGYTTEQWRKKEESNLDIKVIYKEEIKFYLDYVINKYGIDFTRLYDNSNPKIDISKQKTFWVHKDGKNTVITKDKLEMFINEGWVRGRTSKKMIMQH